MEDSDSLSEVPRADLEEEVRVLRRKVQQLEEAQCRYLRTLEEKVIKLEDEVQCHCKSKMSANFIAGDDHMTKFYTWLPTHVVFLSHLTYLEGKASRMRLWRGGKEEEKRKQEGKGAGGRKGRVLYDSHSIEAQPIQRRYCSTVRYFSQLLFKSFYNLVCFPQQGAAFAVPISQPKESERSYASSLLGIPQHKSGY